MRSPEAATTRRRPSGERTRGERPSTRAAEDERADRLFQALADATRRDIVQRAMQGDHSVSDLARCYPMSFAAVQKHVALLERADLVTKERRGRRQLVRTNPAALRDAHRLLDQLEAVWRDRLDRFEEVLTEPNEGDPTCP